MNATFFYRLLAITTVIVFIFPACTNNEVQENLEIHHDTKTNVDSKLNDRGNEKMENLELTNQNNQIKLTIIYDNEQWDKRLENAWGFACVMDLNDKKILFDTGGDGEILLNNMEILGIKPVDINVVFISHEHYDHTGGLMSFLKINNDLTVYILSSYSEDFKKKISASGAKIEEIKEAREIYPDIYTTGELINSVKEQSLIIRTLNGLVIITGCAHPGIVNIIKRAKGIADDDVYLILGGFHLKDLSSTVVESTINELKDLGVKKVAPSHCTGALALQCFQDLFGEDYIKSGLGKTIIIESNS